MKNILPILLLFIFSYCSTPGEILEDKYPNEYFEVTGNWYILSEEVFGKIQYVLSLNNDGSVNGDINNIFNLGGVYSDPQKTYWEVRETNSNNVMIAINFVYTWGRMQTYLEYNVKDLLLNNSIYKNDIPPLKVCRIGNRNNNNRVLVYAKDRYAVKNVVENRKRNNKDNEENIRRYLVGALDIIDNELLSIESESVSSKYGYYDKLSTEGELFYMAYFNSNDNHSIDNKIEVKDEFQFNRDKNKFTRIKKFKYCIWKFKNVLFKPRYNFETHDFIHMEHLCDNNGISVRKEIKTNITHSVLDFNSKYYNSIIWTKPIKIRVDDSRAELLSDYFKENRITVLVLFRIGKYNTVQITNYECESKKREWNAMGWIDKCVEWKKGKKVFKYIKFEPVRYILQYEKDGVVNSLKG